jgi:hypothetical protein
MLSIAKGLNEKAQVESAGPALNSDPTVSGHDAREGSSERDNSRPVSDQPWRITRTARSYRDYTIVNTSDRPLELLRIALHDKQKIVTAHWAFPTVMNPQEAPPFTSPRPNYGSTVSAYDLSWRENGIVRSTIFYF